LAIEIVLTELLAQYPSLLEESPEPLLIDELKTGATVIDARAGARLFEEGKPCQGFPLVVRGEICVSRNSADQVRTMELYRVVPGEICVVSTSSLLASRNLNADGIAVMDTRIVLLSPALFERWTARTAFRRFVFGVFSERLIDLMALIDAIAFQRLDQRLAHHLLGHGQVLRTTHHALADELGTVREIVTRILNRFEAAALVRLSRERIEVLDAASLRAVAAGESVHFRQAERAV
jgi:CRP/FNR family transcriptional regulator